LIVNATLAVLELWSENARQESGCDYRGILAYMPKLTWIFTFFVLVAVGLPISSMFWNNFVVISALFRENFAIGIGVMMAITLIATSLAYELFMMRNLPHGQNIWNGQQS
jgi:NADH:ubiquinone oxidoreductase subunit 4 (subunit M)